MYVKIIDEKEVIDLEKNEEGIWDSLGRGKGRDGIIVLKRSKNK